MPSFSLKWNSDLTKVAANGADNIVFTLRSNLGQQAQPLAKWHQVVSCLVFH